MQKWKYATLQFSNKGNGYVCRISNQDVPLEEALNRAGNNGWEMVSVTSPTPLSLVIIAFFKMPAP